MPIRHKGVNGLKLLALLLLGALVAAPAGATPPSFAADRGEVTVTIHACPAEMRPLDLEPADCAPDATVADLAVFPTSGSQEGADHLSEPLRQDATLTWRDIPFGRWVLKPTELASGYDRYVIPGRRGLNAPPDLGYTVSPNEGYLLTFDAEHPRYEFDLYVFRTLEATGTVRLGVRLWQCPAGVVAAPEMDDLGCVALAAAPSGFTLRIMGRGGEFSLDQLTPTASGLKMWETVPRGEYVLQAELDEGTTGYAARSSDAGVRTQVLSDGSGYALVLSSGTATPASAEEVALDVYLLR